MIHLMHFSEIWKLNLRRNNLFLTAYTDFFPNRQLGNLFEDISTFGGPVQNVDNIWQLFLDEQFNNSHILIFRDEFVNQLNNKLSNQISLLQTSHIGKSGDLHHN